MREGFVSHKRWAVLLVILALAVTVGLRYRFAQMDGRFFDVVRFDSMRVDDLGVRPSRAIRFSWPALKGLSLYVLGAYAPAARAYREHLRSFGDFGTSGDPMEAALARGERSSARRLAEESLRTDAQDKRGLLTLGRLALDEGHNSQAVVLFDRVLDRYQDQLDALLLSAIARTRAGEYGPAIDTLKRALRDYREQPRNTSFLFVLETAGELGQRSAAERPLCLLAHYHRFLRIFDHAQGKRAARYAEQAIAAGDRIDDAWVTVGMIDQFSGRREASLEAFAKAVAANPRNPDALYRAAQAYGDSGDPVAERRLMMEAAEAGGDDPYYSTGIQNYLVAKRGDYHQAREYFLRRLAMNPNNAADLQRLGEISILLGQPAQATEYLRRALVLQPNRPETLQSLAQALFEMDRLDESQKSLEQAIALDPTRAEAFITLGTIYERQNKRRLAIRAFEQALERTGDDAVIAGLCWLYSLEGAHEKAVRCFHRVLSSEPTDQASRARLSMAEKALARHRMGESKSR